MRILLHLILLSLLICIGQAHASPKANVDFPDAELLYARFKQAAILVEPGFRKYLRQNCAAAQSLGANNIPERHAHMCLMLSLLNRRDAINREISTYVDEKKVFVLNELTELESRAGFFAVNPRLTESERTGFITLLLKKILLGPLLKEAYTDALAYIKSGPSSDGHDSYKNAPFAAMAAASISDSPLERTLIMAEMSTSIRNDVALLLSRNFEIIGKVAGLVENYNSIIWPEYEAFKPIIKADQIVRVLKKTHRASLLKYVLDEQRNVSAENYAYQLSEFVELPLQYTDETLKGLYTTALFSLDLRDLIKSGHINDGSISTSDEYKNSFMLQVEADLLQRLNLITDILRKAEHALTQ